MNKKLVEEFVDEHYSENFKIIKSYIGGDLSSIEIMPAGDGQSIYIWNEDLVEEIPVDNELTIELNMQVLGNCLQTDEEGMLETINYFLGNTPIVCICADYGDFTDVMAVDVDMSVDDVVEIYITPLLCDIGALSDDDSDTLSYLVNYSILTSSDGVDINGVRIYMTEIPKSLYDTMEEV